MPGTCRRRSPKRRCAAVPSASVTRHTKPATEGNPRQMTPQWPENGDDKPDPALEPLIEAGEGESEGFELAEQELVDHASHGDQHSDRVIGRDALGFDSPEEDPAT